MNSSRETASLRHHRRLLVALVLVAAGLVAWWLHGFLARPPAVAPAPATPVTTNAAVRRDMPDWVAGVGTVTPLNVVTVRSRVDGQLDKVAFTEGQMVRAGDLLAEIDPRPFQAALGQADAASRRDAATHANAVLDLGRYQKLSNLQVVPRQQLDAQKAQAESLLATVASDHSAADAARLNLSFTRIMAPITGRVGERLVDQGSQVHASDATGLVTVTQIEPIQVAFSVSQDMLTPLLAAEKTGPLAVTASTRDGATTLATGVLVFVDSHVSPTTGQIVVKAQFDNHEHTLWPGAFVAARLLLDTQRGAVAVPSAAIQRDQTGSFVYVVDAAHHVQLKRVVTGVVADGFTRVVQGLGGGENVVVDGQGNLQPGALVDDHAGMPPAPTIAGAVGGA